MSAPPSPRHDGRRRSGGPPPVGGPALWFRARALTALRRVHAAGTAIGALALLPIGGFVPVLKRWLADDLGGWDGVVSTLGGVRVGVESADPDADLGPTLARPEAPELFAEVAGIAGRLGVRAPEELRLAFLPCCGVAAAGRRRVLLLGLPLLRVLSVAELRAVLAHELAHLARGDATGSARSVRFVAGLGRALEAEAPAGWGLLRAWSRACHAAALRLIGPIAAGQEARADRASAAIAGGDVAASALVTVALVQPIFREVLNRYDPGTTDGSTLYGVFRRFWDALPEGLVASMRHRLLADRRGPIDPAYPPLLDRLAIVQSYPPRADAGAFARRASTLLGDLEGLEQRLQEQLFPTAGRVEASVFHRAGS